MSEEEKFDAIVVGAGPAGSTAAYVMAKAGLAVLLIERGDFAGSKNMTGGRLYAHSLEKIIPGFAKEAPVSRRITKEKITMMTKSDGLTIDFTHESKRDPSADSYSVMRCEFDQWLADKAEEAGAMVACGVKVDDLIIRDGKVCGVVAGEDEMEADVVVLADGVISPLAEKAGLKKSLKPSQVALGAKEVLELPEKVIEDRFGVGPGEGVAWLFAGCASDGQPGGGFIYTNQGTLSVGIVFTLEGIHNTEKTIPQMLDEFKEHPLVAPLVKDAKLVEYSAHLVPEAGKAMIPTLYKDGVLVTGDAAGLVINIGYMVRGMDLAIASGEAAAKAVIAAKEKGDFSAASLSSYKELLDASFVMRDMEQYQRFPVFMENRRIFKEYPEMISGIMRDLFIIDGKPKKKLLKMAMSHMKKVGYLKLAKDGMRGMKAL